MRSITAALTNVTAIGLAATFFQLLIKLILTRYYVKGASELAAMI